MKLVITKSLRLAALLLLVAAPTALTTRAQEMRLQLDNLDKLEPKASESVNVTLDGSILRLAVAFLDDKDPEERAAKELVMGLKGIYVKVYQFDKAGEYSEADVDALRQQLRSPGWSRMVGVKSKKEGENMEVYTTMSGSQMGGLTVLTFGDRQLGVIQIIGTIDLEKLIKLSGKLGIPSIDIAKEAKEAIKENIKKPKE
ncbi:MAG TPA: DUF4252 domain-containing protein [Pyrinomonadaceae bacterium]|nr:DUF4252 domain-containing protein [Pyrinomonadaceae bacterium]